MGELSCGFLLELPGLSLALGRGSFGKSQFSWGRTWWIVCEQSCPRGRRQGGVEVWGVVCWNPSLVVRLERLVFVCSVLQTAACGRWVGKSQRVSVRWELWDGTSALAEQPKGAARSGGSACSEPPCRTPGALFPARGARESAPSGQEVSAPGPLLDPHRCRAQSKSVACFPGQSYMESGDSRPVGDAEGQGGKSSSWPLGPKSLPLSRARWPPYIRSWWEGKSSRPSKAMRTVNIWLRCRPG